MHYPVIIPVGNGGIHIHLLLEMLAFTIGYRYYVWLRKRSHDPVSEDGRFWVFLGAAFGAFWGSHILGVLERNEEVKQWWLYFMANKTIVGGLLGGLAGVEITKKIVGIRTSTGDLLTYPIIAGLCIGRVGCHLEGLEDGTFGLPSGVPWAINFGDGIPRHPVNLYEIVFLLLVGLGIHQWTQKHILPNGARFKILMVAYLIFRFFVEYLKPAYFWPSIHLSSIQMACLAGLGYYLLILWKDPISTTISP
jgi:phosphatidylglycerol---prolipoprotein diacylglyceryl transferase